MAVDLGAAIWELQLAAKLEGCLVTVSSSQLVMTGGDSKAITTRQRCEYQNPTSLGNVRQPLIQGTQTRYPAVCFECTLYSFTHVQPDAECGRYFMGTHQCRSSELPQTNGLYVIWQQV